MCCQTELAVRAVFGVFCQNNEILPYYKKSVFVEYQKNYNILYYLHMLYHYITNTELSNKRLKTLLFDHAYC